MSPSDCQPCVIHPLRSWGEWGWIVVKWEGAGGSPRARRDRDAMRPGGGARRMRRDRRGRGCRLPGGDDARTGHGSCLVCLGKCRVCHGPCIIRLGQSPIRPGKYSIRAGARISMVENAVGGMAKGFGGMKNAVGVAQNGASVADKTLAKPDHAPSSAQNTVSVTDRVFDGRPKTGATPWSAAGSVSATPPSEGIAGGDTWAVPCTASSQGGVGARSSLCHRTPRCRPLLCRKAPGVPFGAVQKVTAPGKTGTFPG